MEKVFEEEKAYLNYTQEQLSNSIATQEKEMLEIPKRTTMFYRVILF